MRLIDKNKDYYDGAIIYSDSPIWVRKRDVIDIDPINKSLKERINKVIKDFPRYSLKSKHNFYISLIGFCGKMYPIYTCKVLGNEIVHGISPEDITFKVNKICDKEDIIEVEERYRRWWRYTFNDDSFNDFLENNNIDNISEEMCLKFNTPVFAITDLFYPKVTLKQIIINSRLTDFGFQSIIDPWTASQEIEYYIGNVIVSREYEKFEMSDELKRDSKGMDKWSFKQMGPKKRKQK